ncbi:hypothetical protein [Rhizobium azibense]|uniref:Exodeoxyribonuclease X n=1 Tax=Rhizobium azibense TaxID=1136135 RepID=A0A4R3RKA7_9HYPH|nr:hypothetical protein [Rhizobium azibense]TCU34052.1 exodeoxyribonuclease X [Rhizobium azibense]
MKIRVYDLESGPDPDDLSNGIIEIGWTDVICTETDLLGHPCEWVVGETKSALIDPINQIPYETSGIHHLVDSDVAGASKWDDVVAPLFTEEETADIVAYAAHNIEMEQKFLTSDLTGSKPWICTFQCALHLYPQATSHANQAIRYMLNPDGLDRDRAHPAHRAGPDSYVTAHTLAVMLNDGNTGRHLAKLTQEPALLYWCKHRRHRDENGKPVPWTAVDSGYLRWMFGKDFSKNEFHTVSYILDQREIDQRNEYERQELNRQYRANAMPETERFGANDDGKPANDFNQTRSDGHEHRPATRDVNTMELPL